MIERIAVIGAGTMGHGIAHVFAMHGYQVNLYEAFDQVREAVLGQIREELNFLAEEDYIEKDRVEDTLSRITLYGELAPAGREADFVIGAIPEQLELEKELLLA